jgi:hypothetical protein
MQRPISALRVLQTPCPRKEAHQNMNASAILAFLRCGDTKCHARPALLPARHHRGLNPRRIAYVTPVTAWRLHLSDDAPPLQTLPNYPVPCLQGTMTWVQRHTHLPILVKHALTWICHLLRATAMGIMARTVTVVNALQTPYRRKVHLKPQIASAIKAITLLQILRALPVLKIQCQPTTMQETDGVAIVHRVSMLRDCHRRRGGRCPCSPLLEINSCGIMILILTWTTGLGQAMDRPRPVARSLKPQGFSNVIAPPSICFPLSGMRIAFSRWW